MQEPLEQFVHEANVERFETLLKDCRDDAQRKQLQKLLSEEKSAGKRTPPHSLRSRKPRQTRTETS